jgi:N6-adenosine-specific RNA methylase IME4
VGQALEAFSGAPPKLSVEEAERLAQLERVVAAGFDAFVEVASALVQIRDLRLYRANYRSFEDYARDRWGLARRTAYGYIEAARVLPNVPPEAQLSLTHLRALAPLSAQGQRELAPVVSEMTVTQARRVIREWREQQRAPHEELPLPPLPDGAFRTIVADPPWRYEADYGQGLARDAYPTMTKGEIESIPVGGLAADDAHLYLWTTVAKVPDAIAICAGWGFEFKSLITWIKPGLGMGTWWRVSTEHIVFGVRGRLKTQPNLRNWFEAPRSRHSRKPDEAYELIERASPGPYIDLFARRERDGWTCWGNELPETPTRT